MISLDCVRNNMIHQVTWRQLQSGENTIGTKKRETLDSMQKAMTSRRKTSIERGQLTFAAFVTNRDLARETAPFREE